MNRWVSWWLYVVIIENFYCVLLHRLIVRMTICFKKLRAKNFFTCGYSIFFERIKSAKRDFIVPRRYSLITESKVVQVEVTGNVYANKLVDIFRAITSEEAKQNRKDRKTLSDESYLMLKSFSFRLEIQILSSLSAQN